MSYSDVDEAITGVLRASGVTPFDWNANRNPYYVEAAIPMPVFPGSVFAQTPFPFVVYELPESTIEHSMSDPYIETYRPRFFIVGNQKHRRTVLSPYDPSSLIYYLDSLRGTIVNPNGPNSFSGDNFQCIHFVRSSYYLGKGDSPGTSGENVWVAQASYEMQFNVG